MIPSQIPNTLFISSAIAITMIVILFFLPAIIELKRPKDAGPRLIKDNPAKVTLSMLKIPIIDIEEGQKLICQFTTKSDAFLHDFPDIEF